MSILDRAHALIPVPWAIRRFNNGYGWGTKVVSAEGEDHGNFRVTREDGAFLAALAAVSPYAMHYVEQAAEKGGAEAKRILDHFRELERSALLASEKEAA